MSNFQQAIIDELRLQVISDQRNMADLKERIVELDLEIEADNRNAVDFINRIAELDREVARLLELNRSINRDLDDCQRAYDRDTGKGSSE